MSIGKVFALFLLSTVVAAAATCGGHGTQESLIVSTGWLANHMKDANLVVLAVGDKSDYDAEHIAGSQFIEYRSVGVKGAPASPSNCRRWTNWPKLFQARRRQRFARRGLPAQGLADAGGARHIDAGRDGPRQERSHAGRQPGDVEGRRAADLKEHPR